MEEIKVNELPVKKAKAVNITDRVVLEDKSGTSTGTLSSVQLAFCKFSTYNTFAEMVDSIMSGNVEMGMICSTLGYHSVNDNGGGKYLVTTDAGLVDDSNNIIFEPNKLADLGIKLQLLLGTDEYVTVEQFGAYGDGKTDDSKYITSALNSGYPIRFKRNGKYKMTTPIVLRDGMELDFNNSTITFSACNGFIAPQNTNISNIVVKNLNMIQTAVSAINLNCHVTNLTLENIHIDNPRLETIIIKSMSGCEFKHLHIKGNTSNTSIVYGYGIGELSDDYERKMSSFKNIDILNSREAFNIKHSPNGTICIEDVVYKSEPVDYTYLLNVSDSKGTPSDVIVNNATVYNADMILYNNSKGSVILENISAHDCNSLLTQYHEESNIILRGNISMHSNDGVEKDIYWYLNGVLYYECKMNYDKTEYGFSDKHIKGKLVDLTPPYIRGNEDLYSVDINSISIESDHNTSINIGADDHIKEITDIGSGMIGQVVKINADRLIELKQGTYLKTSQPFKNRIFIGTGKIHPKSEYDIDIVDNCIVSNSFEKNVHVKLNAYIKPLSNMDAKLYFRFSLSSRANPTSLGTIMDKNMNITVNATDMHESTLITKLTIPNITLNDLDWDNSGNSKMIEVEETIDIGDYQNITITVDSANLFGENETNIGTASATIYPKSIYEAYAFYPNGITLRKLADNITWVEC